MCLYIPFWLNLYQILPSMQCTLLLLYIPFWLNLYEWRPVPVLGSGRLYIPFWLNLYLSFLSMNSKPKLSLHSILVKSIPVMCRKLSCALTALHSILVKSIRGRMPSPERRCVTLHSILVKSILISRQRHCSDITLYIPFWLNLYQCRSRWI